MSNDLRCPLGDCRVIEVTSIAADKDKMDVEAVEDALGFWADDVDVSEDDTGELVVKAPLVQVDKAAVAITAGEAAYYDSGNDVFTNVVGSNRKCGYFAGDAALAAATAVIWFDGYGS